MRYGIRLPHAARGADTEIQRILDLGVQVRMNCRIGTDITPTRSRPTSTPSSWAWARRAAAAAVEGSDAPMSSPPRLLKAFNDAACSTIGKRVSGRRRRHVDRRRHRSPGGWAHRPIQSRPARERHRRYAAHDGIAVAAQGAESR